MTPTTMTYSELDLEHRLIVDQLNNLQIKSNGHFDSVLVITLQSDFRAHCANEERAMEELHYPYLCAHILAHTIVSKYFICLLTEVESRTYHVSDLIRDLLDHIDTYDAQFNEFLIINQKS